MQIFPLIFVVVKNERITYRLQDKDKHKQYKSGSDRDREILRSGFCVNSGKRILYISIIFA